MINCINKYEVLKQFYIILLFSNSKLFCYSFSAWDTKKEWSTDLPVGEEVIGLAAGDGWIAAATDMNRIRLFTVGGAQRQIIEVGGQIISTAGHEDLLFISYHNGIGTARYYYVY